MDDKPTIDLSLFERDFFGILLPSPSGILWTTQAGGTCCAHPALEGVFIPLEGGPRAGTDFTDPLYDRVEPYDIGLVWRFLHRYELHRRFAPIKNPEVLALLFHFGEPANYLLEAWVPVLIDSCNTDYPYNTDYPQLEPFRGGWGVLVYPNSD